MQRKSRTVPVYFAKPSNVTYPDQCKDFQELRQEIIRLEKEADTIKRRIRGHIPKGTLLPVDKFELFRYLREQDSVLDAVEDALDWIAFRGELCMPENIQKDFMLLIDAVMELLDDLQQMVKEARMYFRYFSEEQRKQIKEIIRKLRQQEHNADIYEDKIKEKVNSEIDSVTVFHLVRLAEIIGSIADHAENAGDMMRAMIAK